MSMVSLDKWLQRLGVDGMVMYYRKLPGKEFREGTVEIGNEADVLRMCVEVDQNKCVDVYVRHITKEDYILFNTPKKKSCKVIIEEIENEECVARNHQAEGHDEDRSLDTDKLDSPMDKQVSHITGLVTPRTVGRRILFNETVNNEALHGEDYGDFLAQIIGEYEPDMSNVQIDSEVIMDERESKDTNNCPIQQTSPSANEDPIENLTMGDRVNTWSTSDEDRDHEHSHGESEEAESNEEEDLVESDYDIGDGDDDYQEVIVSAKGKKNKGRPKSNETWLSQLVGF